MSTASQIVLGNDAQRYETLFRISEALSACREPEELSQVLNGHLRELIGFDRLDLVIFKEDSNEIEWRLISEVQSAFAELPIEETASWHVYETQEVLSIPDWSAHAGFPRLKHFLESQGIKVGSVIRVPLTTAHRRL